MKYPSTALHAAMPPRTGFTRLALAALCLVAAGGAAQAQSIVMAGNYQNFDVLNNTGAPTYGFEMEVRGVSSKDLTRIFPSNFDPTVIRYGVGTATDFPGGVIVRWAATYQPASGTWSTATPVPLSLASVPGESCWTWGMPTTYATAGCEHFGISTSGANPTSITYRWLVRDQANPGTLVGNSTYVNIPAPVWTVVPPANPALPPVVVAEVQAPPAPPARATTPEPAPPSPTGICSNPSTRANSAPSSSWLTPVIPPCRNFNPARTASWPPSAAWRKASFPPTCSGSSIS